MKASIKQMPMNECKRTYDRLSVSGLSNSILQSQICARDDKQEKSADTCPGLLWNILQILILISNSQVIQDRRFK